MASNERKKANKRKPRLPNYFFFNDRLYKRLRVKRERDLVLVWSYSQDRRVGLTYSYVLNNQKPAFTTREVAEMIGRSYRTVVGAVQLGALEPPAIYAYPSRKVHTYRWRDTDILKLHDWFLTQYKGGHGSTTVQRGLPSRRELIAMINQEEILYVKEGDEFVPTWRAKD